jgi:RimJ/RimL family protein N-acetyltransferase
MMERLARTGWQVLVMDEVRAQAVQRWRYEPPYDFYNSDESSAVTKELTSGEYMALEDDLGVAAFFCTGASARVPAYRYLEDAQVVDVGLGMRPDLTGRGMGRAFGADLLDALRHLRPDAVHIRLTVAQFNVRAIRVYQPLGFEECGQFTFLDRPWCVMQRKL